MNPAKALRLGMLSYYPFLFWVLIDQGVQERAGELGVTLTRVVLPGPSGEDQVQAAAAITELASQGLDAFLVLPGPTPQPELLAALDSIQAAGIPLVGVVGGYNDNYACYIRSDGVQRARVIATYMAEQLNYQGK